ERRSPRPRSVHTPRTAPPPTLFPYTTLFRAPLRVRSPTREVARHYHPRGPAGARIGPEITPFSATPILVLNDPTRGRAWPRPRRSEEHTSELQSLTNLACRPLLEKKKNGPVS